MRPAPHPRGSDTGSGAETWLRVEAVPLDERDLRLDL